MFLPFLFLPPPVDVSFAVSSGYFLLFQADFLFGDLEPVTFHHSAAWISSSMSWLICLTLDFRIFWVRDREICAYLASGMEQVLSHTTVKWQVRQGTLEMISKKKSSVQLNTSLL